MDVPGATRWSPRQVVGRAELLARLEQAFGAAEPVASDPHAPAERWRLPDGTIVGIVASTTAPFCARCDRARLTADGTLFSCLYAPRGLDLRGPLRTGADDTCVRELVTARWRERDDQGAERRLAVTTRLPLLGPGDLQGDPRFQMHTRGG
jgi:GTP 3',8-cyclase